MTTDAGVTALPATLAGVDEWDTLVSMITQRTGLPVVADAESFGRFVGQGAALLFEASTAGPDVLRACFAPVVVAQFQRFPVGLQGCTGTGVAVRLLAAPPGPEPVLRIRVDIHLTEPDGRPGTREHFWDVELDGGAVVVGSPTCPNCGAGLAAGALVCPYCHADARRAGQAPLLVVKVERLS